jgi:hypothetical protein
MNKWAIVLLAAFALAAALFIHFEVPENTSNTNASEKNDSAKDALNDSYPEHPTLADCEKTSKKDFCIGDVAEINQNIALCQQIQAYDIRTFCIARLSLNKTMCQEIVDRGLSDSCIESIETKAGRNA